MNISVLLVEDDQDLREELAIYLGQAGFSVTLAGSIGEAEAALSNQHDLLILDINLPDGDGLAFCRQAHRYVRSGIIMCTGRSERELRIASLREGADAYLVKPVDPEELVATLLSVHRRLTHRPAGLLDTVQPHPWNLDPARRLLVAPNRVGLILNAGEVTLLAALFGSPDQRARKDDLITLLGQSEPDYTAHRLEVLVSRLRSKVQSRCGLKLPIVSEYGRGYTFAAPGRVL